MAQRRMVLWAMVCAGWGLTGSVLAQDMDGLALLGQFLQQAKTGRAQFSQTVTSAPKNGQPARPRTSSGVLEFMRPGRFRFAYKKPFEQTLVADGQTLWLHDPDLQQATARSQALALADTPLALITSATQLSGVQADFVLQAEAVRDGLQWVRATPRRADGQIRHALVGLRAGERGPELVVLDVQDVLGQRSVLTFSAFDINPSLKAEVFKFQPPAGTDVIRP